MVLVESYLIRGLLIGLIFGVPAGAIGALTIQRTLNSGFWAGLTTGLGSSAADLLYACAGVFGITLVSELLIQYQRPIGLLGGVLIAMLGIHIFRQRPRNRHRESAQAKLPLCFATSFAIAITNPATVLSFLMAFTAFEITGNQTAAQSVQLLAGILLGTLCWWSVLAGVTAIFRERVNDRVYQFLNRLLGCLMVVFAGVVLARGLFSQ